MELRTESEQAILDYFVTAPGKQQRITPPGPARVVAYRGCGGPGADPATVRFLRCRVFPQSEMHYVAFDDRDGGPRTLLVRAKHEEGRWKALPIGGGGGGHPYRSKPWVNFSAQWNEKVFAAGGEVIGDGSEGARHVRMRFSDGTVVDDTLENGIVLFFVPNGVDFPADVEILDANQRVLSSYVEFERFASPSR